MAKSLTALYSFALAALVALALYAWLVAPVATKEAITILAIWLTVAGGIVLATIALASILFAIFWVLREQEFWLTAKAQRRLIEKDVNSITATRDSQIFLRGKPEQWTPMHLPRPGAKPLELAAWQMFHNPTKQLSGPQQPISVEGRWPEQINLLDLLPPGGPSISNVVLGVTMINGQQQIIAAPLSTLVHICLAGSSGWGKSVMARGLAYQLALSPEPVELCFVDMEAATFSPFSQSAKLKYPLADEESQALIILQSLADEMGSRKELYKDFPQVDSLELYNQRAGDPLPPIACLIDEASNLMDNKAIEKATRTLALRARKYGIYLLLSGQDFKANTLDSSIRNQMSTRIQLKAQDATQSRILLGVSVAKDISKLGRGYAVLPGRNLVEIQTPYIGLETIIEGLPRGNGQQELSFPKQIEQPGEDDIIRNLIKEGLNNHQVCQEMGLTPGGKQYARIDAARGGNGSN